MHGRKLSYWCWIRAEICSAKPGAASELEKGPVRPWLNDNGAWEGARGVKTPVLAGFRFRGAVVLKMCFYHFGAISFGHVVWENLTRFCVAGGGKVVPR